MIALAPLPVVVPFLAATVLLLVTPFRHRGLFDLFSVSVALTAAGLCAVLALQSAVHPIVYWFGGWRPRGGVALGIAFVVDPLGAGLATFVAVMVAATLAYSWKYFKAIKALYHAQLLLFLGAATGFCLSGDLFNLFVFYELMSVVSYSLTTYQSDQKSPLIGGLNFAVTHSIAGALLVAGGIGTLYGRTGALNFEQVGRALENGPVDQVVVLSLTLILVGFFAKAAVVPFHFGHVDAHSVAPTPACVLFSTVVIQLGIYGAWRVYTTVFWGALAAHQEQVQAVFFWAGALSAVLGGVMCLLQRHLLRMLAFSAVSHVGMLLVGTAAFTPDALAGGVVYIVAHGVTTGALFMCAGLLLHTWSSLDELELRGRGRSFPWSGTVFFVAGLAVSGLPPFGMFLAKTMLESAVPPAHQTIARFVFLLSSTLTGAAVLRAAGRIYMGWGSVQTPEAVAPTGEEKKETLGRTRPIVMQLTATILLLLGLLAGQSSHAGTVAKLAGERFLDVRTVREAVLGQPVNWPAQTVSPPQLTWSAVRFGMSTVAAALTLAALSLLYRRRQNEWYRYVRFSWRALVVGLNALHSGRVSDYVLWLMAGVFGLAVYLRFVLM